MTPRYEIRDIGEIEEERLKIYRGRDGRYEKRWINRREIER